MAFVVLRPDVERHRRRAAWCQRRWRTSRCPVRCEIVEALPLKRVRQGAEVRTAAASLRSPAPRRAPLHWDVKEPLRCARDVTQTVDGRTARSARDPRRRRHRGARAGAARETPARRPRRSPPGPGSRCDRSTSTSTTSTTSSPPPAPARPRRSRTCSTRSTPSLALPERIDEVGRPARRDLGALAPVRRAARAGRRAPRPSPRRCGQGRASAADLARVFGTELDRPRRPRRDRSRR